MPPKNLRIAFHRGNILPYQRYMTNSPAQKATGYTARWREINSYAGILTMTFLYQYQKHLDHVLDIISNKRLYFSAPSNFNDPFDCRPKFSLLFCKNDPEEIWKRYFFLLARCQDPGISDEEAHKHADAALLKGKHQDKQWLREADNEIRNTLNDTFLRVSCFSKSPRNAMMWAHYADNHKGVVLQFRKSCMRDNSTSYRGFEVKYYRQPVPLKRYVEAMEQAENGDDAAFARLNYCLKSYEWTAEDEVRFFSQKRYVTYPETMLTGILFGSECSIHWQHHIHTALSKWISKPIFFKEDSSISSIKLCFRRA